MKNLVSAGFILYRIVDEKPLFLLLHYTAGHWDFPKGKIEKNESEQEAAVRELYEEAGIEASHIDPDFKYIFDYIFTDYDGVLARKQVLLFLAECVSSKVTLSQEHQGYEWLSYNNALMRLTYDNAKEGLKSAYNFMKIKLNYTLFL